MICGHNEKGLTGCTVHTKSSPSLLTNGTTDPWTMSLYFSSRSSSWLLSFLKTDKNGSKRTNKNGSKRTKVSQMLAFFLTTSLHELLAARLTSYDLLDDCIWTDSVWCAHVVEYVFWKNGQGADLMKQFRIGQNQNHVLSFDSRAMAAEWSRPCLKPDSQSGCHCQSNGDLSFISASSPPTLNLGKTDNWNKSDTFYNSDF